jgi:hypothetical protein
MTDLGTTPNNREGNSTMQQKAREEHEREEITKEAESMNEREEEELEV